eukprot:GEZU01032728.1.p1 GENE.GEZU01032728.1~~GEZU01032728.1.p1  ORF type:complete len:506 (-),score=183.84 GEZU01032728.1:127-1644(-)
MSDSEGEYEIEYIEEEVEVEEGEEIEDSQMDDVDYEEDRTPKGMDSYDPFPDVKTEDDALLNKKEYYVYTQDELNKKQEDDVWAVHQVLNVPVSIAGALLRYYGWDKEKLYAPFFEDPERVCKKAGVVLDAKTSFVRGTKGKMITCTICFDDYDGADTASLRCNHIFCNTCWKDYCHARISSGPSCLLANCPHPKCTTVLDESVFKEFSDKDKFQKYAQFLSRSFVDENPHIKWCPAPNCGRAVYCPELTTVVVKCDCNNKFCFKCGYEAHAPASCALLKEWLKKEKDESETATWLTANTKVCPKCNTAIEKNGGCNHMTCSRCRHEFCWICNGNWSEHGSNTGGYYSCNKYKPSEVEVRNQENARALLEKYMHYYTRYANHDRSKKFESALRSKAQEKMQVLQQANKYTSWVDVEYIQKGVEQLIECRTTLKYTYVFAFYMEQGKEKNLFEWLQEDLEKTTERLSELLELPSEKYNKDSIIATTNDAKRRLHHLLEGVENGLVG